MSNQSNTTICSIAESILTKPYFRITVIIESIFGVYAFLSNIFLLFIGWRVVLFPLSLRILLGHLSFTLAWFGLGGLSKSVYILTTAPCDHVITLRACRVIDMITTNLTLIPIFFSLSAVCLERIWATIRYRRYDRTSGTGKSYVAMIWIFLIWSFSILINSRNYPSIPLNQYTPMCDTSVFVSPDRLIFYLIGYIIIESLAVIAILFIYFYNRHMLHETVINRALYDLSARFQIDQNVQINAVMLPSMILHSICFLLNYTFMMTFVHMDTPTKATLIHISYLWRLIYAGVHPTLALILNNRMKQELKRNIIGKCCARMGVKLERNEIEDMRMRSKFEVDARFRHLDEMWSAQKTTLTMQKMVQMRIVRGESHLGETTL